MPTNDFARSLSLRTSRRLGSAPVRLACTQRGSKHGLVLLCSGRRRIPPHSTVALQIQRVLWSTGDNGKSRSNCAIRYTHWPTCVHHRSSGTISSTARHLFFNSFRRCRDIVSEKQARVWLSYNLYCASQPFWLPDAIADGGGTNGAS